MDRSVSQSLESDAAPQTVGEAWLRGLKARGVDMFFANAGTDFPSVVEGLARAEALALPVPRPIIAPHENAAVSMAHGYTLVTGHAQAVMVHVNVGTANSLNGLINAERDYVPMLFAAGRTPLLEVGDSSSRSLNIHWAQDMFDQGGMVREFMRWDFELRDPRQLEPALDRALTLAHSAPRGPVQMILPREVLAAAPAPNPRPTRHSAPAAVLAPDPDAIKAAVAALARARRPLIITARSGADRAVPQRLGDLATKLSAPVVEFRPRHLCLSTAHPLHGGFESQPWFDTADAILVLDCDVPWIPSHGQPHPEAVIIQAGDDPLQARYPTRGFASDITLRGTARLIIDALLAELDGQAAQSAAARASEVISACARVRKAPGFSLREPPATLTMAWASFCVDQRRAPGSILVNEYPLIRPVMETTDPGTFFGSSPSGGLGWGLPAAIGVKLAAPDTEVIVASGDGSWIFANPVACHQIAAAEGVAILAVIFNNAAWGAVHRATQAVHPDGYAVRANRMPLTSLDPSPSYAAIAEACGLWGDTVADPAALPAALDRALKSCAVRNGPPFSTSAASGRDDLRQDRTAWVYRPWNKSNGDVLSPPDVDALFDLDESGLAARREQVFGATLARIKAAHPFYRKHFETLGTPIETLADLAALPITTKQDYIAAPDDFRLGPEGAKGADETVVWDVMYTTGSSGQPTPFVSSAYDFINILALNRNMLRLRGVHERDSILNLFPLTPQPHGAFTRAMNAAASFGLPIVAALPGQASERRPEIGHRLDDVVQIAARTNASILWGVPSYIRRVLGRCEELGVSLPAARLIFVTGEGLSEDGRADLVQRLRALGASDPAVSISYGATEMQGGMVECRPGAGYHNPAPDQFLFEAVDSETHRPVADGAEGLILLTHLDRRGTVMLRYSLGDVAGLTRARCPVCGALTERLTTMPRRVDGFLKIKGMLVNPQAVLDAIRGVAGVGEFQAFVEKEKPGETLSPDRFVVRVVPTAAVPADFEATLARAVRAACGVTPIIVVTTTDDAALANRNWKTKPIVDLR